MDVLSNANFNEAFRILVSRLVATRSGGERGDELIHHAKELAARVGLSPEERKSANELVELVEILYVS